MIAYRKYWRRLYGKNSNNGNNKILFWKGIKVLSLFFIDEVKKYKDYKK